MSVGVQPFKPTQVIQAGDLWRWSVEKYHELIETGILMEDDPVELLEGYIVMKHDRSGEALARLCAVPGRVLTPPTPPLSARRR